MADRTDPWGIDPGYEDCDGNWRATPPETREAILRAMGAEGRDGPPDSRVVVMSPAERARFRASGDLKLEDGGTVTVDGTLPPDLPSGYHDFYPRKCGPCRLILTPGRCHLPAGLRIWGWAVQLYALHSAASWGIGDLEDLRRLAEWSAGLGARILMLNPLCAANPICPQQPSPYYPSSRRFRNPIYLHVDGAPPEPPPLAGGRRIQRDRVFQLKMEALEQEWSRFGDDDGFERYCAGQGQPLEQFAIYCALAEHFRAGWRCWPAEYRRPESPEVARFAAGHKQRVRFHQWLQWRLDRQLAPCAERIALMQDLPVGVDPNGADAWAWQDVLAENIRIGAPPDPFAANGQDWGMPPFIPHKLRAVRYQPFIETIRSALGHAGGLRVDHVMGLFRLFWIPQGAPASAGAYVRYNARDLLGIMALESCRAKAIVVGEDLGTVEKGVRETLAEHAVLGCRVLWFESDPPSAYPAASMASITTHDLPTLTGLWTGCDVAAQKQAGMNPNEESVRAMRERLRDSLGVTDAAEPREVVRRAHELLAAAPSAVITATLDDALAVEERPNMPSTIDEWPNWSLALPKTLEELQEDPLPRSIAAALHRAGR